MTPIIMRDLPVISAHTLLMCMELVGVGYCGDGRLWMCNQIFVCTMVKTCPQNTQRISILVHSHSLCKVLWNGMKAAIFAAHNSSRKWIFSWSRRCGWCSCHVKIFIFYHLSCQQCNWRQHVFCSAFSSQPCCWTFYITSQQCIKSETSIALFLYCCSFHFVLWLTHSLSLTNQEG